MSRVMRKIDFGIWQKSITGGGLTAPWLLFSRQFLRYKDAEIVYSLQHKKLLELASEAGAIYRMDGTVLINRDIFDEYLERFHEPSTLLSKEDQE